MKTRWMRRAAMAALLAMVGAASGAEVRPIEWIVAVVDAEIVTFTQMAEELRIAAARLGKPLESILGEEREELAEHVIEKLVADALILQEARRRGITVLPAEIDEAANETLERVRSQFVDQNAFERALAAEFVTPAQVRERYRAQAEGQLLRSRLIEREVRRKIRITDEDVAAAYARRAEEINARHILTANADEAAAIRRDLLAGGNFEELGRRAGIIEAADLGWARRGAYVKAFEEAAFALKPGGISEVVQTRFGHHVIQVMDRRTVALPPLTDELKDTIRDELYAASFDEIFNTYLAGLQERATIEIRSESLRSIF